MRNETICDAKFYGDFEGCSVRNGRKGSFLVLCFFLGAL